MNIGETIREIRKNKGLTMKELGNKVGLSEQGIGNYERGDRKPNIEILTKIAKALNVSVNDLIGFSINIEMHTTENISPKGQELMESSDLLKQSVTNTNNIRAYQLAGDDNDLIIDLIIDLLNDIRESNNFFPSVLGGNNFEKLQNKNYVMDTIEKSKIMDSISNECSKMPIYMGKICIDLYKIISHTQNLANITIDQKVTSHNSTKIIEKTNLSNIEYENLGKELLHLIEFFFNILAIKGE